LHNVLKFSALIVVLLVAYGCAPLPQAGLSSDPSSEKDTPNRFIQGSVSYQDQTLHFVESGTPGKPLVIFIHGTPGSWQGYQAYLRNPQLQSTAHMIAIDRLGFGESAGSGPRPSFEVQAQSISKLFERNQSPHKVTIVGHSLGGSIGYRIAIDYPHSVGALVAISSAISADLSAPRWYNHLAKLGISRWLLPDELNAANAEMMRLETQLDALELSALRIPVTIIQGDKDKLVNVANVAYAQQTLLHATLRVRRFTNAGHFLLWKQVDMVVKEILHLLPTQECNLEQVSC